jgi:hypothetical protein
MFEVTRKKLRPRKATIQNDPLQVVFFMQVDFESGLTDKWLVKKY